MAAVIRMATGADGAQAAAIYAPSVESAAVSFELEAPTADEMRARIVSTLEGHPWLVCERDGEMLGYAYACAHRTRVAYQWCTETSVYISPRARRAGVGGALYTALLEILPLQNFYAAYAGITLPNAASIGLHESMGFELIGVYRNAGFKLGRWHDVGWWQYALQPLSNPAAPLPLAAVAAGALQDCLDRGTVRLAG